MKKQGIPNNDRVLRLLCLAAFVEIYPKIKQFRKTKVEHGKSLGGSESGRSQQLVV